MRQICANRFVLTRDAFARIDLLTLVALVGAVLLTVGGTSREASQRAVCYNNLRQLGVASLQYAEEHNNMLPPRASAIPRWPTALLPYYRDARILLCPADSPMPMTFGSPGQSNADTAPRSYVLNGWNDYWNGFPTNNSVFPLSAINEPAQTVLLGEKESWSGHFWFDYWSGDDYMELEQGRHLRSSVPGSGASHYTLADGSVRMLRWGESFDPTNLWAVRPESRNILTPASP